MTFYTWLRQFRDDDSAIGDLARDAVADRCFPRKPVKSERLERYEHHLTERHNASDAAVETLRTAWDAFEREQRGE